ncbi:Sec-independent protein translocase protein TatB, partial [Mycobacterium avium subsp. paratuberculosis]
GAAAQPPPAPAPPPEPHRSGQTPFDADAT